MHVELRNEAIDDLVAGASFYSRQSTTAEAHFLNSLDQNLAKLATTAGIHEKYRGFHRKLSTRFPFAIYDLANEETVDVVAILDGRTDPLTTDQRLGRSTR